MLRITRDFRFDAPHSLQRTIDAEGSRRIHGHSYQARIYIEGETDANGMVIDGGYLQRLIEPVRAELHQAYLDKLPGLGAATIENLARFIFERLEGSVDYLVAVKVWRESQGDSATYWPTPEASAIR